MTATDRDLPMAQWTKTFPPCEKTVSRKVIKKNTYEFCRLQTGHNHAFLHGVKQVKVEVFDPIAMEHIGELRGCVDDVRDLKSLNELLLALRAELVTQEQVLEDDGGVESHVFGDVAKW